ncbi:MAG: hypothetical protein ABSG86_19745 [Thermoguttaceae bacterium]|jgi:hypothetical protein
MKKSWLLLIAVVALVGGTWLVRDWASAQGTLPAAGAADQRVQDPNNWHRVVYAGMEFTVYTGPGQAMFTRLLPQQPPAARQPAAKPAESKLYAPR